jgi:hypothetical protein
MNPRMIHDRAFVMTKEIVGKIAHNYREEELRDMFEEFFAVCKDGLQALCLEQERLDQRLRPTNN